MIETPVECQESGGREREEDDMQPRAFIHGAHTLPGELPGAPTQLALCRKLPF